MIPKLIHFVGPKHLDSRQCYLIELARKLHPEWGIRVWSDEYQFDNKTLARYHRDCAVGAQRGDVIRLDVVWAQGGIYLDTDVRLLRSLDHLVGVDKMLCCSEDGYNLTNAFFGAPPKNSAIGSLIEKLVGDEPDWSRPPNETTGPQLFSSVLRYRSDIEVLPRETFYPYNWNEPAIESYLPATAAVHEWAASWKGSRSKEAAPAPSRRNPLARTIRGAASGKITPLLKRIGRAALPSELTRAIAKHQPASYSVSQKVVALTRHSVKMMLPGEDLSVVPSLILRGEFEPPEEAFVASIIKGGDWMIDVGANVGLFSLLAATKCGPFGRVFAVEPDAELCGFIKQSAHMNWVHDRLKVLNCAASDRDGDLLLQSSPNQRRGDQQVTRLAPDAQPHQAISDVFRSTSVSGKTLDSMFPLDVPIKLMKIDVEGHEVEALAGAKRLFERHCIEYLVIEVSHEHYGPRFGELIGELRKLRELGYSMHTATGDGQLRKEIDDRALYPFLGHRNVIFKLEAQA